MTNKLLHPPGIALIVLLTLSAYSFGAKIHSTNNGIVFFSGTWKEAIEKAGKENKPIFLDIYAKWCPPCKRLQKHTFTNKEVTAFYNRNFINLSLDGEEGEGAQIAAQLGVSSSPALLYFDKMGKPVLQSLGYLGPNELMDAGKSALKRIQ